MLEKTGKDKLRIVIADDERPARAFLAGALRGFADVEIVGEATDGAEAIRLIEETRPDLALLDLHMPEVDGLNVARLVRKDCLPLVAFVTAYDEHAVRAFELSAIDYLLKPVERARLRETLDRAWLLLGGEEAPVAAAERLDAAVAEYEAETRPPYLERLPIRQREEITLLPVNEIAAVVAEGELLHVTTIHNERHTFRYRLKDLEARLDPVRFVRLGRGALANREMIRCVAALPNGNYTVTMSNDQRLDVSRMQSRVLREEMLRL